MRSNLGAVAAVVALLAAGCSDGQGSDDDPDGATGGAAECQPMVRFEGTIYLNAAYSSEQVTQVGMADNANCDDNGEDARGAFFPPNPRQVEGSAFEGIPTSDVIGVRQGDLLGVFVSENVTDHRAEHLVDKVATPSVDRQEIGTLDVGHCWIEPVTFDGARWALPRTEQFGLGDRLPAHWEGTGEMERLSENRARYVDDGGAVLVFYPADAPAVRFMRGLCA